MPTLLSSTEAKKAGKIDFMAPKGHDSTKISGCCSRNISCLMVKGVLAIPGIVERVEGRRGFEEGVYKKVIRTIEAHRVGLIPGCLQFAGNKPT